ncbi:MAG TPA: acyl-CoA dehydrogenase family protein [Syntrophorhabdus sp.]|nr:acyl-CoA dehydrogenase family protein [Syntrophorhabdus sp.]
MYLKDLLTKEQHDIRQTIKKFVDKEIMPIREKLEEDYSLVESVHKKLVDMGIQRAGYPEEYGGGGSHSATTLGIVCEELARGDAGISLSTGINGGIILQPAMMAKNKAILDKFVPAFCENKVNYACLSMTDSAGGADSENPLLKGKYIATKAELDGNEWVINGNKSWPTHAGLASVYLTVCTTDPKLADDGIAIIYVPGDAKGLSFGKPETKMGYRTSINGSVFYDNVRVPKEFRLAGPGHDAHFYYAVMGGAQWHSSTMSLGIAQAAFDIALAYTGERMSGSRPVREWSLAAGVLADMAIRLETTRALVYNYAWMMDHPEQYGPPFTPEMVSRAGIVRIYAADAAVWVANKAMELLGSNGLSPEYHLEKYLRDSKIPQLWLGGQQVSHYRVVRGYYDYTVG